MEVSKKPDNKKPTNKSPEFVRSTDVPVTVAMFSELQEFMRLGFEEMRAQFRQIDTRFEQVCAHMDGRFHELKLIFEEQNARNIFVLDSHNFLSQSIADLKQQVEKV